MGHGEETGRRPALRGGTGDGLLVEAYLRAGDEEEVLHAAELHRGGDGVRPLVGVVLAPTRVCCDGAVLNHDGPPCTDGCILPPQRYGAGGHVANGAVERPMIELGGWRPSDKGRSRAPGTPHWDAGARSRYATSGSSGPRGCCRGWRGTCARLLVGFLVWDLTGSELDLGVTAAFQAVPVLVLGLLGGALADAVDRKRLLVYTQTANLLAMALLPVLIFTETVQVWHLWLLTSFWSGANILGRPAQRAFLPRLLPRSHIMNGITWFGALSQGTLFGGPFLAGTLIVLVDVGWAFVVNCAFLFFAIIATIAIRTSGQQVGEVRRVSLAAIWEGARFLKTKEVLWGTFLMDFGVMSFGFFRPLMPALADVYGVDEVGLGMLFSAPAAGSILGTLILLRVGDPPRKGAMVVLSYVGYSLGLVALGFSPWFLAGLAALAFLGLMDIISFTARQALIQLVAPDRYRGRAGSFSSILAALGNSGGGAEMGALAAFVGAPGAFIINGCIGMGITAGSALKWRGIWRYDQRTEPAAD